jgi:hypothetical protein
MKQRDNSLVARQGLPVSGVLRQGAGIRGSVAGLGWTRSVAQTFWPVKSCGRGVKLAGWHLKEEIWELEEKVMAVAYSLWESHSTGVSLEAENRTGWGTLQPQKFMAVFSHPARFWPGRT